MNRRGFLQRVAKAIVIAVAAPVIVREALAMKVVRIEPDPTFWYQTSRVSRVTDSAYEKAIEKLLAENPHFAEIR